MLTRHHSVSLRSLVVTQRCFAGYTFGLDHINTPRKQTTQRKKGTEVSPLEKYQRNVSEVFKMEHHVLSAAVRNTAYAGHDNRDLWHAYSQRAQALRTVLTSKDIALVCSGFAHMRLRDIELFQLLSEQILQNQRIFCDRLNAYNIFSILSSYATLDIYDEPLFTYLASLFINKITESSPADLSGIANAFAKMNIQNSKLLAAIMDESMQREKPVPLNHLALVAHAVVALKESRYSSFFDWLTHQVVDRMNDCKIRDLAMITHAFACINYDPTVVSNTFFPRTAEHVCETTTEILHPRTIALLAGSFSRLGCCHPRLFNFLAEQSLRCLSDFNASDLAQLASSFTRCSGAFSQQEFARGGTLDAELRSLQKNKKHYSYQHHSDAPAVLHRITEEVPRLIASSRPADLCILIYTAANTARGGELNNIYESVAAEVMRRAHQPSKLPSCDTRLSEFTGPSLALLLHAYARHANIFAVSVLDTLDARLRCTVANCDVSHRHMIVAFLAKYRLRNVELLDELTRLDEPNSVSISSSSTSAPSNRYLSTPTLEYPVGVSNSKSMAFTSEVRGTDATLNMKGTEDGTAAAALIESHPDTPSSRQIRAPQSVPSAAVISGLILSLAKLDYRLPLQASTSVKAERKHSPLGDSNPATSLWALCLRSLDEPSLVKSLGIQATSNILYG